MYLATICHTRGMQYEIEIKSLLGSRKAADALLQKVMAIDPSTRLVSEQHQLNHYYVGGELSDLARVMSDIIDAQMVDRIHEIAQQATSINVRTRQKNDRVLLIVKGSLDSTSAVHSHHRMEFEEVVPLTLAELDRRVELSGWQLEAKWQADRKLYETMGITLDLFFTPGYGYMAEFERVVHDDTDREAAHEQLVEVMRTLGVQEVSGDRLERMFAYYNQHWSEYYGTDKIFTVA